MSASFLEIIELPNGDFTLQRVDEDGETLLTISFSKEARDFLQENNVTVARAMINAGIQAVGVLSKDGHTTESEEVAKTIH